MSDSAAVSLLLSLHCFDLSVADLFQQFYCLKSIILCYYHLCVLKETFA